jgi:hypothetical protein
MSTRSASRSLSQTMTTVMDIIEKESSSLDEVKVFVTSWNMGNAEPEGFAHILKEKNAFNEFDIFAIGLQESTFPVKRMSVGNAASGTHESINYFANYLMTEIFDDKTFFVINHCYRAQLQLFLVAKLSLKDRITKIESCMENTGFLHVFPNKVKPYFSFVCCYLIDGVILFLYFFLFPFDRLFVFPLSLLLRTHLTALLLSIFSYLVIVSLGWITCEFSFRWNQISICIMSFSCT